MSVCMSAPAPPVREAPPRRVRKPIILVGFGRSGTLLLSRVFEQHPDVAFLGEPRPIWMHGNAYRRDHRLVAEDLTPEIADYIDRRFAAFLEGAGRTRLLEKTPSNCLRLPFVHALYPDARIVNIIRDGRPVVRSAIAIQRTPVPRHHVLSRVLETPLRDWPAYVPLFLRTVWRTNVLKKPAQFWGVQPPGWEAWLDLPPHVVVAKQWQASVRLSIEDGRELPPETYREIRFEDFMEAPEHVIAELAEFCELRSDGAMVRYAREQISPARRHRWDGSLTEREEAEMLEHLQPLLSELGYE